ncbi:MAG: helix-turn-helix domain-containing protein, partial [Balneolales bacterium]
MTTYRQLTLEDRVLISHLRWQGLSYAEVASQMGRHRSTIDREFERNSCYSTDGSYRPTKADSRSRTRGRRSRSRRNRHYDEHDFKLVRYYLRQKWSPEQITGFLKANGLKPIFHETIYQYIWRDKANGGSLWTHLRQSLKQRRKRYKAYDSRGRLANKRH